MTLNCKLSSTIKNTNSSVKFNLRYFSKLISLITLVSVSCASHGQEVLRNETVIADQPNRLLVPFAFYNDTIGTAIGATYAGRGLFQPQSRFWATAIAADSGTRFGLIGVEDLRTSRSDRLFFDARLAAGNFSEIDVYVDGNPDFANETAGSNDSDSENFLGSEGTDNGFDLGLSYLLPLGDGRDQSEIDVVLRDGMLIKGGRSPSKWNPVSSGLTSLNVNAIYRDQDTESDIGESDLVTAFFKLSLEYDNTDFTVNPSKGSRQEISVSRDWGGLDSTNSWTTIEVDLAKYFSLGSTKRARQRVLAFNAWWIDTPSWDEDDTASPGTPPPYAGASLGGLRRLRGYPEGRFNSRSAVYYSGEYRYIPHRNKIANWSVLKKLKIKLDWFQLVGFAEVGRVADDFDISELHEDMKWSGGVGLRAFANHLVVRAELATSDEDSIFVMSINHPF